MKNRRSIFAAVLLLVLGIALLVASCLAGRKTTWPFKLTSAEMRFCQLSLLAGVGSIVGSCVLFVLAALSKKSGKNSG